MTVRRFHVLLKRQAQLSRKLAALRLPATEGKGKARESDDVVQVETELAEVEKEMADLGGLDWYQRGQACPSVKTSGQSLILGPRPPASTLGQSKERGGDSSHVMVGWQKELGAHASHTKTDPFR